MKNLIVYGSKYGSSKKYAERLSELTGIYLADYKEVKDLKVYDNVIYLGGIYASKVRGLKKISKKMKDDARLILVTVSLGNPNTNESIKENIRTANKKLLKKPLLDKLKFFHLVGSMDYPNLKRFDRAVVSFVFRMLKKQNIQGPDAERMIAASEGKVLELDYSSLEKIINYLKEMKIIKQ